MRELFGDNGATTLASAITSTAATSISVTATTGMPPGGKFRIAVDDGNTGSVTKRELMLVTAVSGTTLTVVRGIEGSTANTFATGNRVAAVVTAGGLDQFGADLAGRGTAIEPIGLNLVKRGVALPPGSAGQWDHLQVESPMVWFDHHTQQYGMAFAGYDGATAEKIGLAWSRDLLTWTRDAGNPVLAGTGVLFDPDYGSVTGPFMVYWQGTYYLFYIGFDNVGYETGGSSLCLATSTDRATWTRHGAVIAHTSGWRSTNVYHPCILRVGALWYCFFNAKGSNEAIGYATSPDLLTWTVDDANSPLLSVAAAQWDSSIVGDPSVYFVNGLWLMSYFGFDGTHAQDGLAYTTAEAFPLGWTRYAHNPVLTYGAGGSIDSQYAHKPFILRTPGAHYHWYTAYDGATRQIALATETPTATLDALKTLLTSKGDLLAASAAATPARLGAGSNGQVLTADSTQPTGLAWVSPATDADPVYQPLVDAATGALVFGPTGDLIVVPS